MQSIMIIFFRFAPTSTLTYLPESPIRAVDKFCVQPQQASCQIPDETALVYKSPADCSKEYQKFIYDDGVLMHKCSGKYVCPRGLLTIQISLSLLLSIVVVRYFEHHSTFTFYLGHFAFAFVFYYIMSNPKSEANYISNLTCLHFLSSSPSFWSLDQS